MKNKNTECCGKKMNKSNLFIGLLIGLAVLVFGGKILLNQNPLPEAKPLNQAKVDQMIDSIKKDAPATTDFTGTWKSEGETPATLTLNEDGTVSDMDGVETWSNEGEILSLTKTGGETVVIKLADGAIIIEEIVYKK